MCCCFTFIMCAIYWKDGPIRGERDVIGSPSNPGIGMRKSCDRKGK